MDLNNLSIFKMMSQRLGWLTQRQDVLAQNVANADTPGYKPNDLEPLSFKENVAAVVPVAVARTSAMHLDGLAGAGGGRAAHSANKASRDRTVYETSPSGNAVVLEEQMMKVADTAMNYQLITNLYKKHVGMIKTALGRGGTA